MPIIQKLIEVYKVWHIYFVRLEKSHKYTLGLKIENLLTEILESIFTASHKPPEQKIFYLNKASDSLDILKFILQVSWETEVLNIKKYISLSVPLNEAGKMLGGWIKQTKTR